MYLYARHQPEAAEGEADTSRDWERGRTQQQQLLHELHTHKPQRGLGTEDGSSARIHGNTGPPRRNPLPLGHTFSLWVMGLLTWSWARGGRGRHAPAPFPPRETDSVNRDSRAALCISDRSLRPILNPSNHLLTSRRDSRLTASRGRSQTRGLGLTASLSTSCMQSRKRGYWQRQRHRG
jgi:hypothetical protein